MLAQLFHQAWTLSYHVLLWFWLSVCVSVLEGVVVLVMNDWSHTDAECTVSSRPVAALSPEVEASCCLLSSLRFSSDRRQCSFMELYTSTASQSQLRGTHPHPSLNSLLQQDITFQ